MSKEVKRFYIMPGSVPVLLSGDPAYTPVANHLTDIHTVPLVLASDYDALLAERDGLLEWAVERWHAEVANRPLINVHRRSLDDTWRQIIRHLGGDTGLLCGPDHSTLLALQGEQP